MKPMRKVLFFLIGCFSLIWVSLAAAQVTEEGRERYNAWLTLADRAEAVIDASRASSASLEVLRADIVDYRVWFTEAREQNASRIATLQSQIKALGPLPDSGVEPQEVAQLRARLDAHMQDLRVPIVVAQEAHNRANGLISEIDRIIRQRQTARMLERGPSPLNPAHWGDAWMDMKRAIGALFTETQVALSNESRVEEFQENLPIILIFTAIGGLLVVRGRAWAEYVANMLRRFGGRGTGVWTFLVSIARLLLQYGGWVMMIQALKMTGLTGLRGNLILDAAPGWGAILISFIWLSDRLYSRFDEEALVQLVPKLRSESRFYVRILGVLLVLSSIVVLIDRIENISAASRAVIAFPVILMTGLILIRLQRIAVRNRRTGQAEPLDEALARAGLQRVMMMVRRLTAAIGLIAPVVAMIGYGFGAEAVVYPAVKTLALVAVVLVMQRFATDIYALATGKGSEAVAASLIPVLVSFTFIVLSLPVLALIWHARVADLTELWSTFLEGFQIGDSRISPADFLTFAVIFAVGYTITRLLQSALGNNLLPKTRIDTGGQNAIVSGTGYVGIFLAGLIAVSSAGIDLSSLAIVAGALSVGIGFGLQNIVSNFVSGIILLIERPISEGDWIEVGGQMGYVRDISVRSTRIETFDRTDVIVPNSDLVSGTVTNYTRGDPIGRVIVPVGVAYGTDTRKVDTILREIANAHPMVLATPAPNVVFRGFGADSMDFEIRAILRDVNWMMSVKSDLNHEITKRFTEEGIEIPFAQRDVWLRNPEVLRQPEVPLQPEASATGSSANPGSPGTGPVDLVAEDFDVTDPGAEDPDGESR